MKGFKSETAAKLACLRPIVGTLNVPDLYWGDNTDCKDVFGESIWQQFHQKGEWFVYFNGTVIVSDKEVDILEWVCDFAGKPADICCYEKNGKWFAEERDWS